MKVSAMLSTDKVEDGSKADKVPDGYRVVIKPIRLHKIVTQKITKTLLAVDGSVLLHPVSLLGVRSMHSKVVRIRVDLLPQAFKESSEADMLSGNPRTPIEKVVTTLG